MCGNDNAENELNKQSTLRVEAKRCPIEEKRQQEQTTDRAAPCGLLSCPLSVGSRVAPQFTRASSREHARLRLPEKPRRICAIQPIEALSTATSAADRQIEEPSLAAGPQVFRAIMASAS
jgi:hypothetical protein